MTGGALEARALEVRLGDRVVLRGVDIDVCVGDFVALVGPNGSGKTTLLRTVYGALEPHAGTLRIRDADVGSLTSMQRARLVAAMTQVDDVPIGLVVRDVVALGRVPHLGRLQRTGEVDRAAVAEALCSAGIEHLAERDYARLSGGERQRVHLARALAQHAPILVLDEPTNHLDVAGQLELLEAVRALDVTVIVSLHDLNLAAAYADVVIVLADGRVAAAGDPVAVLTPPLIASVYGVHAVCDRHPLHGRLQLSFAPLGGPNGPGPEAPGRPHLTPSPSGAPHEPIT